MKRRSFITALMGAVSAPTALVAISLRKEQEPVVVAAAKKNSMTINDWLVLEAPRINAEIRAKVLSGSPFSHG